MNIPIVMAAFGTGTEAVKTYDLIDRIVREHFPGHDIVWAYTSRTVKRRFQDLKSPGQALSELKDKGHTWAAVQSLHVVCGHEFHRLMEEIAGIDIRISVGLPLLISPEDYEMVVNAVTPLLPSDMTEEAAVLIGHGTDHPSWSAYPALAYMLRERFGQKIHIGLVEEGCPSRESVVASVKAAGFERVRLIPFMLVAGIHFHKDLMGDEDSWKTAFETEGISVSADSSGLGCRDDIVRIYCRHIRDALNVIPLT